MNKKLRRVKAEISKRHRYQQRKLQAKIAQAKNSIALLRMQVPTDTITNVDRLLDPTDVHTPSQDTTMAVSSESKLEIDYARVPAKIKSSTILDKCDAILRAVLAECGCTGFWSVRSMIRDINNRKNQQSKLCGKAFAAQCIVDLQGQTGIGIKFLVQIHDSREGVYSGVLTTSSSVEVEQAFQVLHNKSAKNAKNEQQAEAAQIGQRYLGRISEIKSDGVLVTILPHNPPDYRDAFCSIADLSNGYIKTGTIPEQFHINQQVLVQITGIENNLPIASRKILLPPTDKFALTRTGEGDDITWLMLHFTDSEERIMIVLDMVRHAIERFATPEAWERSKKEERVSGEVYMEDATHPSAPAYLVRRSVANGIIKLWAIPKFEGKPQFVPDKHISVFALFKTLTERGYICQSWGKIRSLDRIIAFCMMEDGYQALGRTRPPLPVVPVKTLPEVEPQATESEPEPEPEPNNVQGIENRIDQIRAKVRNLINTAPIEHTIEEPVIEEPVIEESTEESVIEESDDEWVQELMNELTEVQEEREEVDSTLKLIKEYKANAKRKEELDEVLSNYQALLAERDLIAEWLSAHVAVGETLRLARSTKPI